MDTVRKCELGGGTEASAEVVGDLAQRGKAQVKEVVLLREDKACGSGEGRG